MPTSHYEMPFKLRDLPLALVTVTILFTLKAFATESLFSMLKKGYFFLDKSPCPW